MELYTNEQKSITTRPNNSSAQCDYVPSYTITVLHNDLRCFFNLYLNKHNNVGAKLKHFAFYDNYTQECLKTEQKHHLFSKFI